MWRDLLNRWRTIHFFSYWNHDDWARFSAVFLASQNLREVLSPNILSCFFIIKTVSLNPGSLTHRRVSFRRKNTSTVEREGGWGYVQKEKTYALCGRHMQRWSHNLYTSQGTGLSRGAFLVVRKWKSAFTCFIPRGSYVTGV